MQYYLSNNGQQMGPFDETQLVANGLTANSHVWWEGQPGWVLASQVPALAPYLRQPQYQQPQYQQPYGQPQYQQQPTYGYEQPAMQPYGGYPQQPNYGYNQGQMPPRPESNMVWAILCTVLCCMPLGVVAIIYASGVDSAYNSGNYEEAERKSKSAKNWAMWGAISSAIFLILYFIFVGVMVGMGNY